ncbi:hypothetical protein Q6312_28635, partial [Klebsiella pneumoniae]|uniref:hypothetical protein n=1 Tax=Klebsiella pneumoniae TaxID=573 RepID=UPI002730BE75
IIKMKKQITTFHNPIPQGIIKKNQFINRTQKGSMILYQTNKKAYKKKKRNTAIRHQHQTSFTHQQDQPPHQPPRTTKILQKPAH